MITTLPFPHSLMSELRGLNYIESSVGIALGHVYKGGKVGLEIYSSPLAFQMKLHHHKEEQAKIFSCCFTAAFRCIRILLLLLV